MRCGIIGPSNYARVAKVINLTQEDYLKKVAGIAGLIAKLGFEIMVTPQLGTLPYFFVQEYKKAGGKKVIGVIPLQDTEFGISRLDKSVCLEVIDCGVWRQQASFLASESDFQLCLGFSSGTLEEICFSKWFGKKPVLIIKELVSGQLPSELDLQLNLKYVSLKDLEKELSVLKR